uniref:Uncharacterized protein n=1 Tax=Triticum urartu TaxID=4572 RepID=A0A8R7P045_TRIUA
MNQRAAHSAKQPTRDFSYSVMASLPTALPLQIGEMRPHCWATQDPPLKRMAQPRSGLAYKSIPFQTLVMDEQAT